MKNKNYFKQKLEELSNLLTTVNIEQNLFDEATEYFKVLDNESSTLQEKHHTCIKIEELLSRTRDFQKYEDSANEISKYIENNKDLDNKIINLLNKYIGILNNQDVKPETKVEVWKNYNVIINNIKKKKITNIDIKSKDFALSLIAIIKDSNDEDEKKTAVAVLGELLNESKKNSVINLIDLLNSSNDKEEKSAAEYCLTGYISEITENFEQIFLIQNAIVFLANDGKDYANSVLNYIEIIKTSSDKEEKEAAINRLKEILENNSSTRKRR